MSDADLAANPYKDLAKRFFLTFLLGVAVYRFGVVVPIPFIDVQALRDFFTQGDAGVFAGVLNMANMFNGGALSNGSVFGLGIMPYISASIIMQLLAYSVPSLKALQKEGEGGRRKINQYTRYLTLAICLVQSLVAAIGVYNFQDGLFVRTEQVGFLAFVLQAAVVITTGSMILLWLAEQITKHGVGNGVSVVIMISILAMFPTAVTQISASTSADQLLPLFLMIAVLFIIIIAAMVLITLARRFVSLEQQRRVQGGRQYGGGQTKLPLMLNHAGVIPVIFSQPIIYMLAFAAGALGFGSLLEFDSPGYRYFFAALIIFFTFFYISITIDLNDWANNFKQGGFFIRGVKPGKNTVDFLRFRLTRLTFVGSICLAIVTILPTILGTFLGLTTQTSETILGGIGLLIVVGVSLDVIQKVTSYLLAHQYQGLLAKQGGPGGAPGGKPGGRSGAGKKRF